jgi:hypothetical protein
LAGVLNENAIFIGKHKLLERQFRITEPFDLCSVSVHDNQRLGGLLDLLSDLWHDVKQNVRRPFKRKELASEGLDLDVEIWKLERTAVAKGRLDVELCFQIADELTRELGLLFYQCD